MRRVVPIVLFLAALLFALAWIALRDAAPSIEPSARAGAAGGDPGDDPREDRPAERRHVGAPSSSAIDISADPAEVVTEPAPRFGVRVRTEVDELPIQGLVVAVPSDRRRTRTTDADGLAEIEPLPGELSLVVEIAAPGVGSLTLFPGETRIEVPTPIPLTVRFVSQETGERAQGSAYSGADEQPGTEQTLDSAPLWPAHAYELHLTAAALGPGFVAPQPAALARKGHISRYAERAEITIALPHTTGASVRVTDPRGDALVGVNVTLHHQTGIWAKSTTAVDGTAHFDRLPFFRRATLTAYADLEGRDAEPVKTIQTEPGVEPVIEITLPDEAGGPGVGWGMGSATSWTGRSGRPRNNATGTAALVVRVLRRDGRPAADALVAISGPWHGDARTDGSGTATFDGLPGGMYRVTVDEHGLAGMTQPAELGDGETLRVVLEEPSGRRLRVRVVDAAGRGVPLARLAVSRLEGGTSSAEWVPLQNGAQLLDVHTDRHGEARLESVRPDATWVTATYGGRTGKNAIAEDNSVVVTIPD